MNTNQIFSEDMLNHYLKLYLKDELKECELRIRNAKETLELPLCLPENRTMAQRELEIFTFRKSHLQTQLDSMELVWNTDGTFI